MTTAKEARKICQQVNRDLWIKNATGKINIVVKANARMGKPGATMRFVDLIKGAENLTEAAEMLTALQEVLESNGYLVTITLDGNLFITWK